MGITYVLEWNTVGSLFELSLGRPRWPPNVVPFIQLSAFGLALCYCCMMDHETHTFH